MNFKKKKMKTFGLNKPKIQFLNTKISKVGEKKRIEQVLNVVLEKNFLFFVDKNVFFWLAAGRSSAPLRPAANQKKIFYKQKKESFFLEQRSKACFILFFSKLSEIICSYFLSVFWKQSCHFRNFEQSVRTSFFLFLHLVLLLIVSFFVNEYFWFGQNLVFYFSPLRFFVAFLSFFSNRYFSFGQNFVFCFSPFSFFVAILSFFSNEYFLF